jgi:hypothetical protein
VTRPDEESAKNNGAQDEKAAPRIEDKTTTNKAARDINDMTRPDELGLGLFEKIEANEIARADNKTALFDKAIDINDMTRPDDKTALLDKARDLPDMTRPDELPAKIFPLGNELYDLKFTINKDQKLKLERFAEVLGIENTPRNFVFLFERALELALGLKDPAQPRTGKTKVLKSANNQRNADWQRPHQSKGEEAHKHKRYIPLSIRRIVLKQAGYSCEFTDINGKKCTRRSNLHLDHKTPFAWGGSNNIDNLQVLCAAHNWRKAEVQQGVWNRGNK